MAEYGKDGCYAEIISLPQCAVCKHVCGRGCKAFNVEKRDLKYMDKSRPDYEKCSKFELNEKSKFKNLLK